MLHVQWKEQLTLNVAINVIKSVDESVYTQYYVLIHFDWMTLWVVLLLFIDISQRVMYQRKRNFSCHWKRICEIIATVLFFVLLFIHAIYLYYCHRGNDRVSCSEHPTFLLVKKYYSFFFLVAFQLAYLSVLLSAI